MCPRHEELPAFACRPDRVEGRLSNPWCFSALRKELRLRLGLPGMRELELLLTDAVGVYADPQLNDLPMIARTGFQAPGRSSLHAPVPWEPGCFQVGRSMVRAKVLDHIGDAARPATEPAPGPQGADLRVSSR